MKNSVFFYLFLFFLFIASLSCDRSSLTELPAKQLLLVYMVTDRNGLDLEALEKLKSLKKINAFDAEYRLMVFSDTKFKDSGQLIEINMDGSHTVLKEFGVTNSADKEQFAEIVEYVVLNFKAEIYGLLLFSHASGWLPEKTIGTSIPTRATHKSRVRSVLLDADQELSLVDFADALPIKFDYIIFEACNMAGVELAYQLRNKASYILASPAQMISPGFTDIYPDLIKNCLFNPYPNLYKFINSYYDHYQSQGVNVVNISLIKTDRMVELADCIRSVNPYLDKSLDFRTVQQFDGDTDQPLYFFDFLDYYRKALSNEYFEKVESMVRSVVDYRKFGSHYYAVPEYAAFPIESFSGLSTYIEHDVKLNAEYRKLDWYKATR